MVKPGPMPAGEHNKVESKRLLKFGRFPKLRATLRAAGRAARAKKPSPRYVKHVLGRRHAFFTLFACWGHGGGGLRRDHYTLC